MHTAHGLTAERLSVPIKKEIKQITERMFITSYHGKFNRALNALDDNTKHMIRNNKQLNDLYDLFLDYIIDSAEQLNKPIDCS